MLQVSSYRSTGPSLSAASVSGYRSYTNTDSSDSDAGSEDEALPWRHKRLKCSGAPVSAAAGPFARKVNNIWGSVVQEQSQEAVAAELGIMGMEGSVSMSSRQSETYNYVLARKMMEREREEEEEGLKSMLDGELEGYMQRKERDQEEKSCLKRKRSAKERLGPRAEMDVKGRYELREDDPDQRVVDEIAHRLMEPKKDLIERVVRVIGKKKAIELLSETATVEQNGGLYTVDGSRRRTPGGVYLNLLKNTPSISDGQVKEIFHEENQKEYNNKKAAKKRRKRIVAKKMKQAISTLNLQEHDDVSRETFASDTEEALGSLEEAPEGPSESALGTEDNPVVYNSNDLEVF
ncbi:Phosphorylated adapter RNA export protein [Labeo rohita]|uniref:Phosphorylated adapter RNA export protein n=1 Tax=Labeo rohita TaxID=84645 RepID=A0ABQ8KYS5_LABRO|nr:Phosphorylated adapter RNA export protein [Labeo rohita]